MEDLRGDDRRQLPDGVSAVPNAYTPPWFEVFLDTMPGEWTYDEVAAVGNAADARLLRAQKCEPFTVDLDECLTG